MIIAIQPDNYGPDDASSPHWDRLLHAAGYDTRLVNVYRADIFDQLKGCAGFMWRHAHSPEMRQIAKRLLPVLEHELGLSVYPDQSTCWHYDDKIAQAHIFEALGIPAPKTWCWFDKEAARTWAQHARYPLVLKLWAGAGSTNVRMVQSQRDAELWIDRLFDTGVSSLMVHKSTLKKRLRDAARVLLRGDLPRPWELHKRYALFQEFLPGNDFDTRITVIGNRAFGFRRFNRDNDFRASGSGKIDYDPKHIAPDMVRLAFDVARRLNMQSCAIDGMWRGSEPVIGEISYTYASWAVHACPGHWDSDMNWHEGQKRPEEAQVEDFIVRLRSLRGA